MGDAGGAQGAGHGTEEPGSSWLARCCLVVVLIVLIAVVVVPIVIWAAGILIAGGR
jgi:hypothetical protein